MQCLSGNWFRPAIKIGCAIFLSQWASLALAQTQHGAAPSDQEVILPPARPDISQAQTNAGQRAAALFPESVESDRFLRIATGPIRGGYYAVGGVICDLVNQNIERHRIECLVRPTSGSGENIAHVLSGGAEMGLVQSDWQSFAVTSAEKYSDSNLNFDRLRSVASLYPLAMQIVARTSFGARDLEQLSGGRIGLSMPGSGQRQLAEVILAQAGIRLSEVKVFEFDNDAQMVRALCAGDLDAFFLVGPAPLQPIDVAVSRCGAQLMPISDEIRNKLVGDRAALAMIELDQRTYPSQAVPIGTLGFVVTLVASASLDDRMVAEVARHLTEGAQEYSQSHPALTAVDGNTFFNAGLTAPVHNGSARYLDSLAANPQSDSQEFEGGDTLFIENIEGTN